MMTVAEEAHWRYQAERMSNWGYEHRYQAPWNEVPEEVKWLLEEAKYHKHLADAQYRRLHE